MSQMVCPIKIKALNSVQASQYNTKSGKFQAYCREHRLL